MPTLRLTPRNIANLSTQRTQEEYHDELTPGLTLRVGKGGSKTWVVRYRANGKHRRMKLGRYPGLSLADAGEQARKILAAAQGGVDVARERQQQHGATFGAMAEEVFKAKGGEWREATRRERQRILDVELLPHWKDRPAASITRREVVELVDKVAERAPMVANHVLKLTRRLYNIALRRGFPGVESNPAHMVEARPESRRERWLTADEIKSVWEALEWDGAVVRSALRIALLTGQRIGNVCSMRWDATGKDHVWRIPATEFKSKRPHAVPLSPEAVEVLESLRPLTGSFEFVFPSGRNGSKSPHFTGYHVPLKAVRERAAVAYFSAHDFRRTARTHMVQLGILPPVADACLGHAEQTIGFQHYQGDAENYLLNEKRDALKRWGLFVRESVKRSENESGEVGAQ